MATGGKKSATGEVALVHLMHRASQIAEVIFQQQMTRAGLGEITPRQLLVLQALSQVHSSNQTVLTRRTGIDRSTLADLIRRLKGKGWVSRRRSQRDAREQVVTLTADGRAVIAAGTPALAEADRLVAAMLPTVQATALRQALQSMWAFAPIEGVAAEPEPAPPVVKQAEPAPVKPAPRRRSAPR